MKFMHSLKSSYDNLAKHKPELIARFNDLEDYCNTNKLQNPTGYNSLKWIMYTLRDELDHKQMADIFYFLLAELQNDEKSLYNNIKKTRTYFLNRKLLQTPRQ